MKAQIAILTCARDKAWCEATLAGLAEFWPEMPVRVFLDVECPETPLPDDVRNLVRAIPYLRKVFDIPALLEAEWMYYLDSDCLVFRHPDEWQGAMYQGTSAMERQTVLDFWNKMGWHHRASPRFCAGTFSAERSLFLDNRQRAIEWLRMMVYYGFDRQTYPGVECEQGLVAGLWLERYPDRPLPMNEYPYWKRGLGNVAIWHLGEAKHEPQAPMMLAEYMRDRQRGQTSGLS